MAADPRLDMKALAGEGGVFGDIAGDVRKLEDAIVKNYKKKSFDAIFSGFVKGHKGYQKSEASQYKKEILER